MDIEHKPSWRDRCVAATRGNETRFGAILLAAMDRSGEEIPRFVGRATRTSDGFLMCDFVDRHGHYHMGAYAGDKADLDRNAEELAKHLSLDPDEHAALSSLLAGWVRS